jgi:hypothetical protein
LYSRTSRSNAGPQARSSDRASRGVTCRPIFPRTRFAKESAARCGSAGRQVVLVDAVTELREFVCDPPTAPKRVLTRNVLDEAYELRSERRATHAPRLPRSEPCEAAPMPRNHGCRLDQRKSLRPPRPHARGDDPERTVDGPEARLRGCATENRKLLAEQKVFADQARPRPERCEQRADAASRIASIQARVVLAAVSVTRESGKRVGYAPRPHTYLPSRKTSRETSISSQ